MKTKTLSVAVCLLLGGHLAVTAQSVPPLINYQGQLTDATGNSLATADYELSFRIYDAASGGNPIWGPQVFDGNSGLTGHKGKIPVVQGYFNLMLGPVDINNVPIANAFAGTNRFVEVTISNRPPILPRQQILSAPYAIRAGFAQEAGNAQQLQGRPPGDFVSKAGDSMTGTLNLPANGLAAGGSQLVLSGGNVGIGTTAPQSTLDVAGPARFAGSITSDYAGDGPNILTVKAAEVPQLRLESRAVGGIRWDMAVSGERSLQFINDQPRLVLADGGNVGIGTTTPQAKIHVAGDAQIDGDLKVAGTRFRELAPPGAIIAFGGASRPSGWLMCDGSAVSRSEYSDLYAAIGTTFGAGDGVNTFNVPDLRGEFLRGLDRERGVDNGRALGSAQSDGLRNHVHQPTTVLGYNNDSSARGGLSRAGTGYNDTTAHSGPMWATGSYPAAAPETRPRNVAVNYLIKY